MRRILALLAWSQLGAFAQTSRYSGVSLLALIVIGFAGLLRRKVFANLFQS